MKVPQCLQEVDAAGEAHLAAMGLADLLGAHQRGDDIGRRGQCLEAFGLGALPGLHGAAMATLAGDIREELQERYDPAERRAALRAVVRDDAVWKGLDSPGSNPRQRASDVITDVTGDSS